MGRGASLKTSIWRSTLGCCVCAASWCWPSAAAAASVYYVDAGPRAGVSINNDQWLLGGYARLGIHCPWPALTDLGFGLHVLGGVGGNRLSLRTTLRIDSLVWADSEHTFGFYPSLGVALLGLEPVAGFADFCARTRLAGCDGTYLGAELGFGVRVQRAFLEASLDTGQLPVGTLTAGLALPLFEASP